MPAPLRHFSINADDLPRARTFYEGVFGWRFQPWGPPDFYLIEAGVGAGGALQGRRTVAGEAMPGIEVTFAVENVEATAAAVEAAGGRILMPPFHIETVGRLIYFQDTEGNIAGAMQYDDQEAGQ